MAKDPGNSRLRPPLGRTVAILIVSAVSLLIMVWILPGIAVDGWWALILSVGVTSVLNGLLWPLVARYAAPLILWTAGILGLVANGLILLLAAEIVPGFSVDTLGTAILASLGMTAVSAIVGSILSLDDEAVWRHNVIRKMARRIGSPEETDVPGVLFLQIDGLSESVLRRAIAEGYLPTIGQWVRSGSHRILGWECDLSSQTGASQAGILHGDNSDMPAFRWYDKEAGKVFTSNRPDDAAEIERQHSNGQGLLVGGGVSRSNVFSGDSPDSLFTFSTIKSGATGSRGSFSYFLSDPYAISRLIVLSLADIGREIAASHKARKRRIEPRMKRGGVYPLLRAATTVMLRDITIYTLLGDIYRGVPSAYADFVGYDEVAHHSGIAAPDAVETLYRLDQQFARLAFAIKGAPRPYHIVVLSDHGQTQGATFLQRYGQTLSSVVTSLIDGDQNVSEPSMSTEGWGNLNGVLSDAIRDEDSRSSRLLKAVVKRRTVGGDVVLGPSFEAESDADEDQDVVVLASGNLGLVSFPNLPGRATFETLAQSYPKLMAGLAGHEGIGFVMVRSEQFGPLAIGRNGIHYLSDDRIEGVDPLAPFGPRTADHLRRTDSFKNCPDILVNSFYDPDVDEGAAFEELIGFHGGLGGKQAEPFLLFPRAFPEPVDAVVGAASVHLLFKGWLADVHAGSLDEPWSVPSDEGIEVPVPSAQFVNQGAENGG